MVALKAMWRHLVVSLIFQEVTAFVTIARSTSATTIFGRVVGRTRCCDHENSRCGIISLTTTASAVVQDDNDVHNANDDDGSMMIRPLHQNWWPVTALTALHDSRPNALQVLGRKLVAFKSQNEWRVLDDRCSHRFAPLSEGRVIMQQQQDQKENGAVCRLQCAYHGWEFDSQGVCQHLPQQPDRVDKARSVQAYPVRERAGILWVWTDPGQTASSLAETIPLPVSPLLDRFVDQMGQNTCYMRDLPYGMELLGENLIDLSHLPFAHHSIGSLKRDLGASLPTRMLSESERAKHSTWEKLEPYNNQNVVLPTFQVEITDAAKHDPLLMTIPDPLGNKDSWTCTIGFYSPCHVRYRRWRGPGTAGHVELFMCPTSEGRSRVIFFNAFEAILAAKPVAKEEKKPSRLIWLWKPAALKPLFSRFMVWKMFDTRSVAGHMISHRIFDGDGIFLHMQGNRMKEAGLSYRDYSTPSSADVMLNAYRRYMQRAASVTRDVLANNNGEETANAVVGTGNYGADAPRSEMLDRYNTHTVHCPTCRAALTQTRVAKQRLAVLQSALYGAFGVSAMLTPYAMILKASQHWLVPAALIRWLVLATALTGVSSYWANRLERKLGQQINSFLFEDYVHADKH